MSTVQGIQMLPFETPIADIEKQIAALKEREDSDTYESELQELEQTRHNLLEKLYDNLTPWQTVQAARHPSRPQTSDYINMICRDFSIGMF